MYEANYSDGNTAETRRVRIQITGTRLIITGEDGGAIDEWPLGGLSSVDRPSRADEPIRIAHGEARLSFESGEILSAMGDSLPGMKRDWTWGKRLFVFGAIAAGTAAILIAALLAALPYAVDRLSRLVPARAERALGGAVMTTLSAQYPGCRSAAAESALNHLVRRLAAGRRLRSPIRIRIFRARAANAFTAPGGHIGIFSGLFDFVKSPEEFAGVLAHEMGHAALRHPAKSLLQKAGLGLILSALTGDPSAVTAAAGEFTETLLHLSFTREAELEADREALAMLSRAGIRADGLALFLERIARRHPARAKGGYFSTHPAPRKRIAAMRGTARTGGPAMTAAEWRAIKGICSNTVSW
jgi:predicted Zn-dependent protease